MIEQSAVGQSERSVNRFALSSPSSGRTGAALGAVLADCAPFGNRPYPKRGAVA
jgi:hypothetical protein